MYQDVVIAGFGGQGILVAGKLLAYAGMLEGRHVTWFPSYGAEIRGGTANCTVIISDSEIGSPVVQHPSAMLILNEASYKKFEKSIQEKGLLFLNTSLVQEKANRTDISRIEVKANDIAEELGDIRIANIVMLGAFLKRSGVVALESVLAALKQVLPSRRHGLIPLNEQALKSGARLVS
ncbi:MAG: 2-oxoacid:ferredoxin oxidoreductase subunit gamma [Nitrospirae bacterium GWD2_57_9]|nr:MAG: 2-oxoacid:ferredoxin oxidoreductase subunit gamma [Nitrospirae bacterium GWD2_57_9]OGW49515.1 MAG: 2-oxoacid:ferredoxin oxidoreductase subunit gamma [Nitrospirae bacterium GWC2_57_9]